MDASAFLVEQLGVILSSISFFVISFIGALLKEMYNTNTKAGYDFASYKVVTGSFVGFITVLAIVEYFATYFMGMWATVGAMSFIGGLIGFELFYHISSIDGIIRIIKFFRGGAKDGPEKVFTRRKDDAPDDRGAVTRTNIPSIPNDDVNYNKIQRVVVKPPKDD